jgi:hypothetical protein
MNQSPTITIAKYENKLHPGFDIHNDFLNNGWELNTRDTTNFSYNNKNYPLDEFKVEINNKNIKITVPIVGANCEYTTNFTSYYLANEYLLMHLKNHNTNLLKTTINV